MQASKQLRREAAAPPDPLPGEKPTITNCRLGRLFPAVSPAAPLALAGVFALASVVPGLAGALALARVLALTGVSVLFVLGFLRHLIRALVLILRAERSLQRRKQRGTRHGNSGIGV